MVFVVVVLEAENICCYKFAVVITRCLAGFRRNWARRPTKNRAQNAKIELKIELELDFWSKSIELRNKNRAQIWASQRAGDLFPQGAQVPVQVHSQRR